MNQADVTYGENAWECTKCGGMNIGINNECRFCIKDNEVKEQRKGGEAKYNVDYHEGFRDGKKWGEKVGRDIKNEMGELDLWWSKLEMEVKREIYNCDICHKEED